MTLKKKVLIAVIIAVFVELFVAFTTKRVSKPITTTANEQATKNAQNGLDLDLTQLSATLVYAEVYNMTVNPYEYSHKKVKIQGIFGVSEDNSEDGIRFGCIIQDATQCCAQGVEFFWKGEHKYPDDFPEIGEYITVVGTFDYYSDGNLIYLQLKDAEMWPTF